MHEFKNVAISTKKKKKGGVGGWEGLLTMGSEDIGHREEKKKLLIWGVQGQGLVLQHRKVWIAPAAIQAV